MSQFGYSDPGYSSNGRPTARLMIGVAIALFGIISYFLHTSVNPTTGEKQHVSMSTDDETRLGLSSAPQMAAEMGGEVPASDPSTQLVQQIGNFVHDHSTVAQSPYQYQFHLLADPQTVNAFALPGGQVFITRGLLDKLDDTAELAGVLGHEMGHVVERHSAQQIEKQQLGQTLVMATGVAGDQRKAALAAIADQLITLHYSRQDESQADACGLRFMTEAGFDPRAMVDVMRILQAISAGNRQPEFLATHPDPGNRIEAIEQWLSDHPDKASGLTRGDKIRHASGN